MKQYNTANLMQAHNQYDDTRSEESERVLRDEWDKLNLIIHAAEGRARERRIDAGAIAVFLNGFDRYLPISKKSMEGVTIDVDLNAQRFPRAYRYTPESTHFIAVYKRGSWWITDIIRRACTPTTCRISHTDISRAALLQHFSTY